MLKNKKILCVLLLKKCAKKGFVFFVKSFKKKMVLAILF